MLIFFKLGKFIKFNEAIKSSGLIFYLWSFTNLSETQEGILLYWSVSMEENESVSMLSKSDI